MKAILFPFLLAILLAPALHAQQVLPQNEEELKAAVLQLRQDVDNIQLNLHKSHSKFKVGIATATIGYTVTIAGGLLLANGETGPGRALLIAGGAVGITGTFLLVDAFKYLDRAAGDRFEKQKGR